MSIMEFSKETDAGDLSEHEVAPGFNTELYLELVGDMSDGEVGTLPNGGIQLSTRWNPMTRHTRGGFNPDKERIRLMTRNIYSLWSAGEVLAHETRHYIDWITKYPGTDKYPNYSLAHLALSLGRNGSFLYSASATGQALLDWLGVDIDQLPHANLGQILASGAIGVVTVPVNSKVYEAYYWNDIEYRGRRAGNQWGSRMQEVLADTRLWRY